MTIAVTLNTIGTWLVPYLYPARLPEAEEKSTSVTRSWYAPRAFNIALQRYCITRALHLPDEFSNVHLARIAPD